MAQITIVHTTEHIHRNPLGLLRHNGAAGRKPRPSSAQCDVEGESEPAGVYWKHDVFNNSICFLEWPEAAYCC
jgi:hypothetical protein